MEITIGDYIKAKRDAHYFWNEIKAGKVYVVSSVYYNGDKVALVSLMTVKGRWPVEYFE